MNVLLDSGAKNASRAPDPQARHFLVRGMVCVPMEEMAQGSAHALQSASMLASPAGHARVVSLAPPVQSVPKILKVASAAAEALALAMGPNMVTASAHVSRRALVPLANCAPKTILAPHVSPVLDTQKKLVWHALATAPAKDLGLPLHLMGPERVRVMLDGRAQSATQKFRALT